MKTLDQLEPIDLKPGVYGLTIGSFDGVHKGHQTILKRIRELVGPEGTICAFTFSNHPSHILPGRDPVPMIFSKSLKLQFLEKFGVDVVIILPFTLELAGLSYDVFIDQIRQVFPFNFLVLGQGATLGKKREGDSEKIQELGETRGFAVEYLVKKQMESEEVSSRIIREAIQKGDIKKATELLGHPYMIEGSVDQSGNFTPIDEICLPKTGSYSVTFNNSAGTLKVTSGGCILDVPLSKPLDHVQLTFV